MAGGWGERQGEAWQAGPGHTLELVTPCRVVLCEVIISRESLEALRPRQRSHEDEDEDEEIQHSKPRGAEGKPGAFGRRRRRRWMRVRGRGLVARRRTREVVGGSRARRRGSA
ncbi:hypothetical protein E2C01_082253 [Portunus trituberculatus]|uniref:Uncharacterized protein n=1 Tax=Portunus trituberculatus TaxID=210409 RepID=A0A5B7IU17_PORTR|nr:hypothetical protein [Portunus trituberculatus]